MHTRYHVRNNIVLTITTALYAGAVYHVLVFNIILTLYEGYIVSAVSYTHLTLPTICSV